jgi:hypothetical protein
MYHIFVLETKTGKVFERFDDQGLSGEKTLEQVSDLNRASYCYRPSFLQRTEHYVLYTVGD